MNTAIKNGASVGHLTVHSFKHFNTTVTYDLTIKNQYWMTALRRHVRLNQFQVVLCSQSISLMCVIIAWACIRVCIRFVRLKIRFKSVKYFDSFRVPFQHYLFIPHIQRYVGNSHEILKLRKTNY